MDTVEQHRQFRTIFLSDVHLGTRGCQAHLLIDFLRCHEADTIYLVGDIVDGWRLKRSWYWPQSHNDVVQKILRKGRKGSRIIYIPGNHDEMLREFCGNTFGSIDLKLNDVYELADGRKFLVMHGDEFDTVIRNAKWLAFLGDWSYQVALNTNTILNLVRRRLGFGYWSLSAWLKYKVKNAVNFIGKFEKFLVEEAKRHKVDGVICGHIHHAAMKDMDGMEYVNTGDWVESCTAVVEHFDGSLEVIEWRTEEGAEEEAEPFAEPQVAA